MTQEEIEEVEALEEEGSPKSKITILGDDYKLVNIPVDNTHWNLYFLKKNKKGEDNWTCEYYGVVLRQALPIIINYKIAKKLNGQAVNLRQYLQIWAKLLKIVVKELHGL